jgi:NAD/NADP transhydrogenase beta subunit
MMDNFMVMIVGALIFGTGYIYTQNMCNSLNKSIFDLLHKPNLEDNARSSFKSGMFKVFNNKL